MRAVDTNVLIRSILGDNPGEAEAASKVLEEPVWVATIVLADAVAAALKLFRERALGFQDCLILELARKAGHLPLGTFDRALGRVNGTQKL